MAQHRPDRPSRRPRRDRGDRSRPQARACDSAHPAVAPAAKDALATQFAQLDPVVLLHDIRQAQTRLTALADATPFAGDDDAKADIEAFLDGLRHAWKEGGNKWVMQRPDRSGASLDAEIRELTQFVALYLLKKLRLSASLYSVT